MGYRIPTQAISSIHALKFVDVLEATRDTIILPEEFTAVTGSDFDIDKLFLSTKWLKVKDDEVSDIYENDSFKYHENRMLDFQLQLLMQPANKYASLTISSIDNATDILKNVAKETTK